MAGAVDGAGGWRGQERWVALRKGRSGSGERRRGAPGGGKECTHGASGFLRADDVSGAARAARVRRGALDKRPAWRRDAEVKKAPTPRSGREREAEGRPEGAEGGCEEGRESSPAGEKRGGEGRRRVRPRSRELSGFSAAAPRRPNVGGKGQSVAGEKEKKRATNGNQEWGGWGKRGGGMSRRGSEKGEGEPRRLGATRESGRSAKGEWKGKGCEGAGTAVCGCGAEGRGTGAESNGARKVGKGAWPRPRPRRARPAGRRRQRHRPREKGQKRRRGGKGVEAPSAGPGGRAGRPGAGRRRPAKGGLARRE